VGEQGFNVLTGPSVGREMAARPLNWAGRICSFLENGVSLGRTIFLHFEQVHSFQIRLKKGDIWQNTFKYE
jgi:hypothetical protein